VRPSRPRQRPRARLAERAAGASVKRQASALRAQAIEAGRRSRRQLLILSPLLAAIVLAYLYRKELFGVDQPVRLATAAALVLLGWAFARNLGRALQPRLVQRLDPGAAGLASFLVRLATLVAILLVSLRIAGLQPSTLALGASFTAVILGLAAQQTFGNLFAGVVLISARPFSIGERVRFNGYGMDVEGTVAAHGLLYLTMTDGDDVIMVPNNTALMMSIRPLRQPAAVDMRARLPRTVDPEEIQGAIVEGVSVATKGQPNIALEELDGDEIVVRVRATPNDPRQGGRLASQVLDAVAALREEVGAGA
jgi:small conductance mechanosensitive channel